MKTAFVTGSSKGIGAATAERLRQDGYFVYLHGRSPRELEQLEKTLGQTDSILVADLKNPDAVDRLAKDLRDRLAREKRELRLLVNNAGIFARGSSDSPNPAAWADQFQVNLFAAVRLTELLLPELRRASAAAIVNVASTLGLRPTADTGAYSASKAALLGWTQSLALELGPAGIRVNAVCPGIVDTPIHPFHTLAPEAKSQTLEGLRNLQPLGRIGQASEIAEAIAFLGGEKSPWTTGACLSVDGGINLA